MRAAVAIAVIVFGAGALGCGSKKRQKRTSTAAPVEVISAPTLPDGGSVASATEETEPNDSADLATVLAVGGSVRAKIDAESDADHFRIEIAQAGTLALELEGVDADLMLDIEDPAGVVVAKSDRGPARVKEGVPNLGVTPGRYTVIVRKRPPPPPKKPPRGRKPPAPPAEPPPFNPIGYHLAAQLVTPVKNGEHEPDDDRGTANDLIPGETVTGFVGWTNDADVWKLSLEALSTKNSVDIDISGVEGVALSVEMLDGVGQSLLTRKAPKGTALIVRGVVPVVPAGAPPFHYLTVKGSPSNPETQYQLRVGGKPMSIDDEIEPNDVPDKAMEISDERTRVDAVWSAGDVDCFAIPVDAGQRTIDATVDTDGDVDHAVEMLVDGKVVAKGDAGGKGVSEKVSGAVPPGARAILRVRGVDAPGETKYTVILREVRTAGP